MTSKDSGGVRFHIIFLLILYFNLVTSQCSGDEAAPLPLPPSPPQLPYSSMNSCPDHLISHIIDALSCTSPSAAAPPHDGGDLNPVTDAMSDQETTTATFAGVVVRTFSASRKEEGTQWEIFLILVFPVAMRAVFLYEICPRFVREQVLIVSFVNAMTAFLLPAEWKWVPAVCFVSSLLVLIVAHRLP